jgi:hypothetical protein
MYFDTKSYLKSNRNYIAKHTLSEGRRVRLVIFNLYIYIYIARLKFTIDHD